MQLNQIPGLRQKLNLATPPASVSSHESKTSSINMATVTKTLDKTIDLEDSDEDSEFYR